MSRSISNVYALLQLSLCARTRRKQSIVCYNLYFGQKQRFRETRRNQPDVFVNLQRKKKSIICVFVQGRRSGCYPFIRISSLCIIKHTHAHTHTDIHTNTHACIYFYMRAREARKRNYTHARANMYKYIYMHIHPYMHSNTDIHTHICIFIYKYIQAKASTST